MQTKLPSAAEVRAELQALTPTQIERCAETSGVPVATIYKIRRGETLRPGLDTVRQFAPYIKAAGHSK